jgi:phage shock protein PspC (stress-responsive transcriptional regulator)
MNKTVTINISGIIFHIDEDAFDKLSKYINTIRGYFTNADGGSEIMGDIEARIAEMLQTKTSNIKQVVLMSDVDYVIESMGKPEEFAGDSTESNESTNTSTTDTEPIQKRMFRDGDNKAIGGVCSGIAAYFDVDIVWIRLGMLLLTFAAGMSIWVYLVLWMVIPEAKTTAEKLAMKGEKADINNISRTVKEEAENLKKRMGKYGSDFKNMATNGRAYPRNAMEKIIFFLVDVFTYVGRVFVKVIGILFLILGVVSFFSLFTAIFGISFTNNIEVKEWTNMLLLDGSDFYIGLFGIAMFVGIPILMMIYAGIKLIFKIRTSYRWINLSAGVIWAIGFFLLLYVGVRTGEDFSKIARVRDNIEVIQNETLVLKMNEADINYAELQLTNDDEDENDKTRFEKKRSRSNYLIGKHEDEKYLLGYTQLNIIKSQTQKIELVVVKEANGIDKIIAKKRAEHISYNVKQIDSLLLFDNIFRVSNADKFRKQDVSVILKLPVGKIVYLDNSLENLIYDIENTTNTDDADMLNRRWKMTENGLMCLDCDGLYDENDQKIENMEVSVNGVNINTEEAKVKVGNKGVKVRSKNAQVTIDENGVHVDTKEESK